MRPTFQILFGFAVAALTSCNKHEKSPVSRQQQSPSPKTLTSFEQEGDRSVFQMRGGEPPWGDFGNILIRGMSRRLGRTDGGKGAIQLERTGPFVPPITFPSGNLVVTDLMKIEMEKAGFRGVSFRRVVLAKVVELPWHTWDLKADNPPVLPEDGEPESYILDGVHSPSLAKQMGPLWEVEMVEGEKDDPAVAGNDLFSGVGVRRTYVTQRARRWFEEYYPEWTSFW